MSARVFHPLVLSEMRRTISRTGDASGAPAAVARVRRDLFGPVDHDKAQSFVDKELAAMRKREVDKWGFDFQKETPIENSRFVWERVMPGSDIPEAYALRRLTIRLQQTSESPAETSPSSDKESKSQDTTTTTQKQKLATKQSQMTDFLKCRKRSLSAGAVMSKLEAASGDGTSTGAAMAKRKRAQPQTRQ